MRKALSTIFIFFGLGVFAQEQEAFLTASHIEYDTTSYSGKFVEKTSAIINHNFAGFNLQSIITDGKPVQRLLGYTKKRRRIELFYFPGTSAKKALVIGGVHGSELSSVEIAKRLITDLQKGAKPYYSVIIVPTLFPDNAAAAETCRFDRVAHNVGRYTHSDANDPNRQLPALGKPFYMDSRVDAYGREIEPENQLLLQLIQAYEPDRIVNLHAIKDYGKAGVYADPRTDCNGLALGFTTDSTLAVMMAHFIEENGGKAHGNKLKTSPTALYHLDPKPVAEGEWQPRNLVGATLKGKVAGVSLGSWAATAVCDEQQAYSRKAARILTIEFPGYKKPTEYRFAEDRQWYNQLITVYAASIRTYFLGAYCVEEVHPTIDVASR